ncbi:tRNA-intron lyase [Candidatus Micrarchaeota archaeon]|nr:tRNA-intron lyase [Candidatus Micrarchaeota archaeon]
MALKILKTKQGFLAEDDSTVQSLLKGFFGEPYQGKKNKLVLQPEEVLYLMDVRNAECTENGVKKTFNEIALPFVKEKKFLAKYFCYRDWRDRGIIAVKITKNENYGRNPIIKYPSQETHYAKTNQTALFFQDDLMSIIDSEEAKDLYENHWFGQWGTYKAKKHGSFLKLDAFETIFLGKHCSLKTNYSIDAIQKKARSRRKEFNQLYDVYEDLRLRGFVVKTGFKFGTHFRLYFPGASPSREGDEWMHSKHVIHVFPRESRLLISEWSRAIRVAHGVKKTFILAIPGKKRVEKTSLDYLLYHREKGSPETPSTGKPKYVMLALSEEEEIGGAELAAAITEATHLGLDLVIAICDRETSVTYYRIKRIDLPKSRFEYYEIEWEQP